MNRDPLRSPIKELNKLKKTKSKRLDHSFAFCLHSEILWNLSRVFDYYSIY